MALSLARPYRLRKLPQMRKPLNIELGGALIEIAGGRHDSLFEAELLGFLEARCHVTCRSDRARQADFAEVDVVDRQGNTRK